MVKAVRVGVGVRVRVRVGGWRPPGAAGRQRAAPPLYPGARGRRPPNLVRVRVRVRVRGRVRVRIGVRVRVRGRHPPNL